MRSSILQKAAHAILMDAVAATDIACNPQGGREGSRTRLGHELGSYRGRAVCSCRLASLRLVPLFLSFLSFHSLISQPPHFFEVIVSCLARLPR
jgi:hypothetical protein